MQIAVASQGAQTGVSGRVGVVLQAAGEVGDVGGGQQQHVQLGQLGVWRHRRQRALQLQEGVSQGLHSAALPRGVRGGWTATPGARRDPAEACWPGPGRSWAPVAGGGGRRGGLRAAWAASGTAALHGDSGSDFPGVHCKGAGGREPRPRGLALALESPGAELLLKAPRAQAPVPADTPRPPARPPARGNGAAGLGLTSDLASPHLSSPHRSGRAGFG